jgi:hypothetical protein
LDAIVSLSDSGLNLTASNVYIVSLSEKLQQTVVAVASTNVTNTTVVIGLGSGEYFHTEEILINTDFVLVADTNLTLQDVDFDFRRVRRRLQTTITDPIIVAAEGKRHYIVGAVNMATNGIVLQGNPAGAYSGGIELQGTRANMLNTTFRDCRVNGSGGGLSLTLGARCTMGRYECMQKEG